MQIATGAAGMSIQEFRASRPVDVYHKVNGFFEQQRVQREFEMIKTRWLAVKVLKGLAGNIKPDELRFPFEPMPPPKEQTYAQRRKLRQMQERFAAKFGGVKNMIELPDGR